MFTVFDISADVGLGQFLLSDHNSGLSTHISGKFLDTDFKFIGTYIRVIGYTLHYTSPKSALHTRD